MFHKLAITLWNYINTKKEVNILGHAVNMDPDGRAMLDSLCVQILVPVPELVNRLDFPHVPVFSVAEKDRRLDHTVPLHQTFIDGVFFTDLTPVY